ncbi:Protein O-mannosyl-transferase TMTC3, partial [Geodia barretti]
MMFSVSFLWARLKLNQGPPLFHVDNNPALGFPTPFRQLHWSYLCVYNVWLLLSPSQLCAEYAMGTIPPVTSLSDPRNLLTLATFAGLLSLSCYSASYSHSHHRKIMFGLCLTVLPFLPASNLFFPVGFVIAERVLYIPSMGFCLLVSYGFHLLVSRPIIKYFSSLAKIVLIFLLLAQSFKTLSRNFEWKDNVMLFTSALRVSQTSAKMWNFVGNTHFKAGNNTLPEPYFRKSLEVEPLFPPAHINLVRILKRQKRFEEAIE